MFEGLTPRSLPGQIPHADLGALPTFFVYRYTTRLPGVRDLQGGTYRSTKSICITGQTDSENALKLQDGWGSQRRDAMEGGYGGGTHSLVLLEAVL